MQGGFKLEYCGAWRTAPKEINSNLNPAYLGSDFLDNRMVHLSSYNGAVCLHDDIILLAIFDNIFLLTERMQLRKKISTNRCVSIVSVKLKALNNGRMQY